MTFDHMAVPSNDIAASIEWYKSRFNAEVLYQDPTWAMLSVGGQRLALVSPQQHPPHLAYRVAEQQLADVAMQTDSKIQSHRDGSKGIYLHDPFGNAVELICYPTGHAVYEKE